MALLLHVDSIDVLAISLGVLPDSHSNPQFHSQNASLLHRRILDNLKEAD